MKTMPIFERALLSRATYKVVLCVYIDLFFAAMQTLCCIHAFKPSLFVYDASNAQVMPAQ